MMVSLATKTSNLSKGLAPQEILANRQAVLWTYRHLLRATGIAFKDDKATLYASRQFARKSFRDNIHFEAGSAEAAHGVEHAQGVTKILRENVVQGRQNKEKGEDHYRLRIHEHTQRLDNDTAGNLTGTRKSFKDIKNSQF